MELWRRWCAVAIELSVRAARCPRDRRLVVDVERPDEDAVERDRAAPVGRSLEAAAEDGAARQLDARIRRPIAAAVSNGRCDDAAAQHADVGYEPLARDGHVRCRAATIAFVVR